jgi:type III secretion protein S
MEYDGVLRMTSEAMVLCLIISLPAVLVSATVGLAISFLQAITSIQEQAVSQGAKLIAVIVTLLIVAPWGASTVLRFAQSAMTEALK